MTTDRDVPFGSIQRMHTLFDQAGEYQQRGEYAAALASYDVALPLYREHSQSADLAMCLMNRANCLGFLGRGEEALADYNAALPLYREHGTSIELARCLMNRANCLQSLGQWQEALIGYDAALPLYRKHGLPASLGICLMNRANCLDALGRREEALVDYNAALPLYRQRGVPASLGICLMNRANCLDKLGRWEEALAGFDAALPLYREYALPADLARCLMNRANCLHNLGLQNVALAGYDEAVPLYRTHGLPADLAVCLTNQAFCLDALGRWEEALAGYEEALPLLREHGLPADLARCLMNLTACLDNLGRREDALAGYDEVVPLYREHGLPTDLAVCLMNRAGCLHALGRWEEALVDYDEAFSVEDRASTTLQDYTHRLLARQDTAGVYRDAIRLALVSDQPDRAWSYAQRAKGRTLTDLLEARGDLTALDRQEFLLVQQHEAGLIDEEAFASGMQHIGDQREAQRAARLGHDPRTPASLVDVAAVLRPGEVFLDMFMSEGDGSLTLFLLRPGQTSVRWVGHVDGLSLQAFVQRWQAARTRWASAAQAKAEILASTDPVIIGRRERLLADGGYDTTMADATLAEQQVLAELGTLVFVEMLEQLDETGTTLIVSPDGLLHRLPLAATTLADDEGQQVPLLDRFDLQLVPTASSLAILRGPHGPRLRWPAALLAAAPFATDEDHGDHPRSQPAEAGDRMTAPAYTARDLLRDRDDHQLLKYSGPEIQAIAAQLAHAGCPTTVLQQEATRPRLEIDLPAARILHLATHGGALEAGESVLDYRIFLAGDTELRVRELYDQVVSLKGVVLVTLSACSLGEVMQQGAEALGFVQAFLQAGAGVVLAPLWAVDDRATRELMVRFYEELTTAERPTVATAWRRACQRVRTETPYSHPIYWAGFLPSGDASLRLSPSA